MKKEFKVIVTLILLITLLPLISSTGTCTLDKEMYHPGEKATFSCTCTSPLEENAQGYMVWRNSTGDILQNVSTNSNSCRTNLFSDSFIFPSDANYLGNATFETGDTGWIGDIISDDFNVSGGHIYDCIIVDIVGKPGINPGGHGAVKFDIKDAITFQPIIHASCIAEAYTSLGQPLVHNPLESGDLGYRMSTAEGEVIFSRKMIEEFWVTGETYIWEFHCFALPNNTFAEVEHIGWYEDGTPSGMKSCSVQQVFTLGDEDLRETNLPTGDSLMYILLTLCMLLLFIGALAIQIQLPFKDQLNSKGASVLIPKWKYVKVMMTLVTYPLFVYFLNFLIVVSNLMRVTVFSTFIEFLFLILMSLSVPIFWFICILTGYLIFADWKIQDEIKRLGSSKR